MRVLVFGDSITQGFWDTEGGWVQRLRAHYDSLQVKDLSTDQPTIFNLGVSADTTTNLLERFEPEVKARANQEVVIMFCIGTNNAAVEGNGRQWSTPEQYKKDLEMLIEKARRFTDKIMFVGLPPCDDSKTTPVSWIDIHYTNERIFEFETVMREVCQAQNIPHVPIFEKLKTTFEGGQELFADGLHPNNAGHELIASIVRPELNALYGKS